MKLVRNKGPSIPSSPEPLLRGIATPNRSARARKITKSDSAIFGARQGDARELAKLLPPNSIDVTITSPPYFDLKDYGAKHQIGFGQDYATYLADLRTVFDDVFRATKPDGSLWIVIDTFRRDQEVFTLPFDLAAKLKEVGWILRDVIIWKKDRTLPWTHKGTTKRIFEYILVLAKTRNDFRYFPDRYRDSSELKDWWIRYPERYNPQGKALEEVWNFNIPRQGSWGTKYIRHFCPLPTEMVTRIINLTSAAGDVVLDPFSGTGTVLTQAHLLHRQYVGFELNPRYITMFEKHLRRQTRTKSKISPSDDHRRSKRFQRLIIDLRVLKYARLLHRAVTKHLGRNATVTVFARKLTLPPLQHNKLVTAEFAVKTSDRRAHGRLTKRLSELSAIPPLSKFGINAQIRIVGDARSLSPYKSKLLYVYSAVNSYKFSRRVRFSHVSAAKCEIVAPIRVHIESPDGY